MYPGGCCVSRQARLHELCVGRTGGEWHQGALPCLAVEASEYCTLSGAITKRGDVNASRVRPYCMRQHQRPPIDCWCVCRRHLEKRFACIEGEKKANEDAQAVMMIGCPFRRSFLFFDCVLY